MCAPAFPIADLLDEDLCCLWLMRARWPGARPVCPKCGGVFSVYTGTIFPRTKRPCRQMILILRGSPRASPPTADMLLEPCHRYQAGCTFAS
jgi:hypothetical protein